MGRALARFTIPRMRWGLEKAISIIEIKFEAAARDNRPDATVFILTAPEHPKNHEIDVLRHIEPRLDGAIVVAETPNLRPGTAVAVVRDTRLGPTSDVEVAVDRLIARPWSPQVAPMHS